jgi:hypothetical protein
MKLTLLRLLAFTLAGFFVSASYGQRIDSMMMEYAEKLPVEKIHIHFDKTVYNRTETVWYKVYILQDEAISISKNVYLEWYDTDGKLIKQTVAPLFQSAAKGSFDIPLNYKGETIRVRAFTRWMMNDDPAFSYEKELTINTTATKAAVKLPALRTKVEIFPEGGFLVQGLRARIAFKATDQYGNPVLVNGVVIENTNKVVDSLIVKHDGMGSFYLTPSPLQSYQINWSDENGGSGITQIPVTKTQGARINLTMTDDKVKFVVERTVSIPDNFKQLTLMIHRNKMPVYQYDINASERVSIAGEFPVDTLPTGLLQFTLFTADWIPVAERVVFVNNRTQEFDAKVSASEISLDKKGKNVFEIFVPDTSMSNMSIAVTDADLHAPEQHSIYSDMLLSSELKGKIYNPAYYFRDDPKTVEEHLDLVMLTNGWRRFDWDKIKALTPPKITYAAETSYMKLSGKVPGSNRGNSGAMLTLITLGKDSTKRLFLVPVEENGTFEKEMFFYDSTTVFYNLNGGKKTYVPTEVQLNNNLLKPIPRKLQISTNRPFLWNDSLAKSKLDLLSSAQELLRRKMAEATLQEVIVTAKVKTKDQILSEKYSSGFFSNGETRMFDLTDSRYVVARNALEYLTGKVAGLWITSMDTSVKVMWRNEEPLYFLNEMLVDHKSVLISIPMNDIAMIKVFRPLFMFSAGGGRGGAIAVYTKKGRDMENLDPEGLNHVELNGYTQFKEFYNPTYDPEVAGARISDNRTTLYWNPNLATDAQGQRLQLEFFNNDFTKKFRVVLEGINQSGKMTRVVRTIDARTKS